MVKHNKESLKQERTRINQLLDQENRICAKCKDKKQYGCEGCFHDKRKKQLQEHKDRITETLSSS